jgi:serine/threonine-protein kinase HipA
MRLKPKTTGNMDAAEIKIWGELAGAVSWNENTQLASFEYDPDFLKLNWDLSPFKMPVSSSGKIISFPELKKVKNSEFDTFKGLPGLLADTLPDKYGNQLINMWLAQQGRPQDSMNPVEMLCFIGTRGMGALEFEPATFRENKRTFSIEMDSLVNIAKKILSRREAFTTNFHKDEEKAVMEILKIGLPTTGKQEKLNRDKQRHPTVSNTG